MFFNRQNQVSEGENTEIDDATEVKKLDEFIEAAVIELALLQNLVSSTNNVDKHIYGAEILRLIRKITKVLFLIYPQKIQNNWGFLKEFPLNI